MKELFLEVMINLANPLTISTFPSRADQTGKRNFIIFIFL